MWPDTIIIFNPAFRQNFYLKYVSKDLAIQEFIPHPSIEALTVSVLPRAARLDICGDYTDVLWPFSKLFHSKFAAIVTAQIFRTAMVFMFWSQPDATAVIEPQSPLLDLFGR